MLIGYGAVDSPVWEQIACLCNNMTRFARIGLICNETRASTRFCSVLTKFPVPV